MLDQATKHAAADAASGRTLALRLRDPSSEITRALSRGGFLRTERDRLKDEVAALRKAPRPKPKQLADKNPVAKPAGGEEYHFELRRNRVTFIDLDRLLQLVKSDAQVRIRINDSARVIESQVGPVGSFSLQYALARSIPGSIEDLMERRGISYDLRSWELVPEFEGRGETFEVTRSPALRVRPRDQPPEPVARDDHDVDLPRRLRPLPQAPRRPALPGLPRRRAAVARRDVDPGESGGIALSRTMT